MKYGLELGLVFVGGIFLWVFAVSFLVGLVFWPWLIGLGKKVWLLYLIGMGVVTACIYGTRMYHKMAACGKNRTLCVITGVGAGIGWGFLWPFLPFVWLCNIYDRWEHERSLRKKVTDFVRCFDDSSTSRKSIGRSPYFHGLPILL
jgi:hypothetical protein